MTYATQGISWGIPGWEALGWTLIHFCWQAAAIALLYRVADVTMGRARSNVSYVLALAALLSMLAAAVVTLGYEEMRGQQGRMALRDSDAGAVPGETAAAEVLPPAAARPDQSSVGLLYGRRVVRRCQVRPSSASCRGFHARSYPVL